MCGRNERQVSVGSVARITLTSLKTVLKTHQKVVIGGGYLFYIVERVAFRAAFIAALMEIQRNTTVIDCLHLVAALALISED